jgi:hypothetical protein
MHARTHAHTHVRLSTAELEALGRQLETARGELAAEREQAQRGVAHEPSLTQQVAALQRENAELAASLEVARQPSTPSSPVGSSSSSAAAASAREKPQGGAGESAVEKRLARFNDELVAQIGALQGASQRARAAERETIDGLEARLREAEAELLRREHTMRMMMMSPATHHAQAAPYAPPSSPAAPHRQPPDHQALAQQPPPLQSTPPRHVAVSGYYSAAGGAAAAHVGTSPMSRTPLRSGSATADWLAASPAMISPLVCHCSRPRAAALARQRRRRLAVVARKVPLTGTEAVRAHGVCGAGERRAGAGVASRILVVQRG